MNVKRVQRIADFVRDARGQEGKSVEPFRLDCLFRRAAAFGDVAKNNGVPHRFGRAWIIDPGYSFAPTEDQGYDVEIQEAIRRIENLDVTADSALRLGEQFPIKTADSFIQPFTDRISSLQSEKLAGSVIQVSDPPLRVGDDDPFLDRVENGLDEPLFLGKLKEIILDVLGADSPEAFDQLVEKTGLHGIAECRFTIADWERTAAQSNLQSTI